MATAYFFFFVALVAAIGFAWTIICDKREERRTKTR